MKGNNKQYLVFYFNKHFAFLRAFLLKNCMLFCSSHIFWLDRKYCRWNCTNICTNTLTSLYEENALRVSLFVILLWPPKFNLARDFFYFYVHGDQQRIIFTCTTRHISRISWNHMFRLKQEVTPQSCKLKYITCNRN